MRPPVPRCPARADVSVRWRHLPDRRSSSGHDRSPAHSRLPTRPGWVGFTLIGLLVVLAIVLMLYFGNSGSGSYAGAVAQSRRQGLQLASQINARQLVTLIVQFQLANGRLPQSVDELDAPPASLLDPWGNRLSFSFGDQPPGQVREVYIHSPGPDGEPDTEDDITQTEPLPL